MRNVENRHETRLNSINSSINNTIALMRLNSMNLAIDNVKALMTIQEDYICLLEKQVEALSGMKMDDYFKEHPRD